MTPCPWQTTFDALLSRLTDQAQGQEYAALQLTAETSQFIRFNHSRVRQIGEVRDGTLTLTLIDQGRSAQATLPCTAEVATDWPRIAASLDQLRADLPHLPADPYAVIPDPTVPSSATFSGALPPTDAAVDAVLTPLQGLDGAGLYAAGPCIRAYGDCRGQRHWFSTESFTLDYSLFTPTQRALKGVYAGSQWDSAEFQAQIQAAQPFLTRLERPARRLERGRYRTYFAPAAVADLLAMLSWGGIGEGALRREGGALGALQRGERSLSSQFSLQEDFRPGLVPRFNAQGEVAAEQLALIERGQLRHTLISSRTAQEYGLQSNYAEAGEYLRSPVLAPGTLPTDKVLSTLGTGLYVANVHYLNWSDRPQGRITGMTRYACFWVEEGELVAPIEDLRFDESLYHLWGDGLVTLTDQVLCQPTIDSYDHRSLGGSWVPGMVVDAVTYTL